MEFNFSRDKAYSGNIRQFPYNLPTGTTSLLVPDDGSVNYCFVEVFTNQCYRPIPGMAAPRVIVDIGANIGLASIYFRMIYPAAKIYAFEPDPRAFPILEQNMRLLGACQAFDFGLTDRERQLPLFLGVSPVNSTVKRGQMANHPTSTVTLRNASLACAELVGETIDILKIDTEGEELPILKSLAANVLPKVQVIYLEFHSHADRLAIDQILLPTHLLWRSQVDGVHRGILAYVHRTSPALREAYDEIVATTFESGQF